ncbi:MAG: D-alanine--D-alanine ligase family protein [Candidatus Rokuibacteriota bacterium]
MARLRIAVAHGPDDAPARRPRARTRPKTDVEQIARILQRAGHRVTFLLVDGSRECLTRMARLQADLVFNLVESFGDDDTKEPHIAGYYELLGLRFTGSGPRGLLLGMDKVLTKKILGFHGIHTPRFQSVFRSQVGWAHDLEFPVIVKPVREDGSIGIGFSALVHSIKELMERIDELHVAFNQPVLIEQYIEGRELYVGVMGGATVEALPAVELDLSHLPEGTPRIASAEVKWQAGTRAYRGSRYRIPTDLPASAVEAMQEAAITGFRALQLRDYARFDFRLTADSTAYLIEANPNPYLHSTSEFMRGARASGRTHAGTIQEIVALAAARYGPRV